MKRIFITALLPLSVLLPFTGCEKNSSEEEVDNQRIKKPEIYELKESMIAFRKSLSDDLLTKCSSPVDSERFYKWHNTPANARGKRDGITYGELDEKQLKSFKAMLKLFLSVDGYQKVHEITVLSEGWLEKIKADVWNRGFYSIDLFGDPEKGNDWAFQLDGHHCVVNFVVQGENVSIVPAFLGAEPAKESFEGNEFDIFRDERDLAVALYETMTSNERAVAVKKSSERGMAVGPAKRSGQPDPFIGDYDYSVFKTGLKYSDMSAGSQKKLIPLMKEYVYNVKHSFADVWWADIEKNLDATYFVWICDTDAITKESVFYYRIYNPYLWVEFNVENITGRNRNNMEVWNHVHTITRIPNNSKNGGDYGKFARAVNQGGPRTLLEHYLASHHHHHSDTMTFDYSFE